MYGWGLVRIVSIETRKVSGAKTCDNVNYRRDVYQHAAYNFSRLSSPHSLSELIASSGWDYYVKLVVSSLDYSQGQWSWRLLERCLAAPEEAKRLYCVHFLRLLARAHCPGFARWGVEMLVSQLYDSSERVSTAALQVVEEVCDYEVRQSGRARDGR